MFENSPFKFSGSYEKPFNHDNPIEICLLNEARRWDSWATFFKHTETETRCTVAWHKVVHASCSKKYWKKTQIIGSFVATDFSANQYTKKIWVISRNNFAFISRYPNISVPVSNSPISSKFQRYLHQTLLDFNATSNKPGVYGEAVNCDFIWI